MAMEDASEGTKAAAFVISGCLQEFAASCHILLCLLRSGPRMMEIAVQVGVKRDEALSILSSDGVLLVLCSLIDNMPYVVAEAAVSRWTQLYSGHSLEQHEQGVKHLHCPIWPLSSAADLLLRVLAC